MDEPACPGCRELLQRVAELEAQVAEVTRRLDDALRSGKRQAAPFRGGRPSPTRSRPAASPAMPTAPTATRGAVRFPHQLIALFTEAVHWRNETSGGGCHPRKSVTAEVRTLDPPATSGELNS